MGLNNADKLVIRQTIVPRCAAAVANFALYILGEDQGAANHANRYAWAKDAIGNVNALGDRMSWHVINQADFIENGSGVADATIQSAVEAAINLLLITPA
jgi:hypothetical protein